MLGVNPGRQKVIKVGSRYALLYLLCSAHTLMFCTCSAVFLDLYCSAPSPLCLGMQGCSALCELAVHSCIVLSVPVQYKCISLCLLALYKCTACVYSAPCTGFYGVFYGAAKQLGVSAAGGTRWEKWTSNQTCKTSTG